MVFSHCLVSLFLGLNQSRKHYGLFEYRIKLVSRQPQFIGVLFSFVELLGKVVRDCKGRDKLTFKLWAARTLHQLTAMDYTQHHAASEYNLILHQFDWQYQLQCDTRTKKTLLEPSTPAHC